MQGVIKSYDPATGIGSLVRDTADLTEYDLAANFSQRAFELRDRVSERERFFISWRYFLDAEQAWDKALELAHSWTATYPREAFAFNSLGLASAAFGQHDEAVRAFAASVARAGDTVLLSPGCASFGLFRDEFDRGEQFRQAVAVLQRREVVAR